EELPGVDGEAAEGHGAIVDAELRASARKRCDRAARADDRDVAELGVERVSLSGSTRLQRQACEIEPLARRLEHRQLLVLEPEIRVDARLPRPARGAQPVEHVALGAGSRR